MQIFADIENALRDGLEGVVDSSRLLAESLMDDDIALHDGVEGVVDSSRLLADSLMDWKASRIPLASLPVRRWSHIAAHSAALYTKPGRYGHHTYIASSSMSCCSSCN